MQGHVPAYCHNFWTARSFLVWVVSIHISRSWALQRSCLDSFSSTFGRDTGIKAIQKVSAENAGTCTCLHSWCHNRSTWHSPPQATINLQINPIYERTILYCDSHKSHLWENNCVLWATYGVINLQISPNLQIYPICERTFYAHKHRYHNIVMLITSSICKYLEFANSLNL